MIELPNMSFCLADAMCRANELCYSRRCEFITPEDLLYCIARQPQFIRAAGHAVEQCLDEYIQKYSSVVPEGIDYEFTLSLQFIDMAVSAQSTQYSSNAKHLDVPHIVKAIFELENSYARDVLMSVAEGDVAEFMSRIVEAYHSDDNTDGDDSVYEPAEDNAAPQLQGKKKWMQYVTCINDHIDRHNHLIGREQELDRTIQVLCRKDKNNPLHVGEPGVGKTALAYGLAARIESGDVPERLKGCRIFSLDMGALMAGTQYRGEMEKRLKEVLTGVESMSPAILYIDEIHTVIGAGRVEGSSLDASNLLKPYLETDAICFMGATTYEEYNRSFVKSKAFARRFEKIDIDEPTADQCRLILHGLKRRYEDYHHVVYTDDAIEHAVAGAAKYINGRYLPDKAIDVIDEAGAWREMHPDTDAAVQTVDRQLIAQVLAHICNVDTLAEDQDDAVRLENLEHRIKSQIYGQDEAVRQVAEAVQMASAGLLDDNKPMASLLFVGPTGVGKTEVARVLAKELALPLLRFDMSEYAEKHTVAKLIGSPAGYVGYDDGGLLTDAIRKTPHCVLLFDELEKAHQDIYNILLQVMDYAVLTDNKGQKADFRHVVFIMTTNAGAQYARQAGVGFAKAVTSGDAMMKSVKQTFKPEFLNRLTDITIFHDMSRSMAELVLDKKLSALNDKLVAKHVDMTLTAAARTHLLDAGFSEEYGGREIDRVINAEVKPLLMHAILFGSLKNGGDVTVDCKDGKLLIQEN